MVEHPDRTVNLEISEILDDEAKRTLSNGLHEFVDYFSEDHFRRESHPKQFKSTMRVHAMGAERLMSLIEDGKIKVVSVKNNNSEDKKPVLQYGHAINHEDKVITVIGMPDVLIGKPIAARCALVSSDFIMKTLSHYRQLRSSGAPLVSEWEWNIAQRNALKYD